MSGEKQKVSPLTEPALPSFQFSIFNSQFNNNVIRLIRKNILGRDYKSHLLQNRCRRTPCIG